MESHSQIQKKVNQNFIEKTITLEEEGKTVLFFSGSFCKPCSKITPFFENWIQIYSDIQFYKVDIEVNTELTSLFEITTLPTFLFIYNGLIVDRVKGARLSLLEQTLTELSQL